MNSLINSEKVEKMTCNLAKEKMLKKKNMLLPIVLMIIVFMSVVYILINDKFMMSRPNKVKSIASNISINDTKNKSNSSRTSMNKIVTKSLGTHSNFKSHEITDSKSREFQEYMIKDTDERAQRALLLLEYPVPKYSYVISELSNGPSIIPSEIKFNAGDVFISKQFMIVPSKQFSDSPDWIKYGDREIEITNINPKTNVATISSSPGKSIEWISGTARGEMKNSPTLPPVTYKLYPTGAIEFVNDENNPELSKISQNTVGQLIFPQCKNIKIGDTWEIKDKKGNAESFYTFKGHAKLDNHNCAIIEEISRVNPVTNEVEYNEKKITYEVGETKIKALHYYDYDKKIVLLSDMVISVDTFTTDDSELNKLLNLQNKDLRKIMYITKKDKDSKASNN